MMSAQNVARQPTVRRRAMSGRKVVSLFGSYALLVIIAVFAVFPFLWTLAISITDKTVSGGTSIYSFPGSLFPTHITINNFLAVFRTFDLARYLLNSIIITGLTIVGTLFVSALAAYPLAQMRFPGRNLLFGAILATLVLPSETAFIVNTLTLNRVHLLGTYWGVIIPTISTAFGIFVMRQAYLSVPSALLEAARMDGATEMQILGRVMLPLSLPSLTALGIFTLVNSWNAYFWPMVALGSSPELAPLSVAMIKLQGNFTYDPFNIAAGAMIMMIPVLLVFLAAQKMFMRGLEGAVKS